MTREERLALLDIQLQEIDKSSRGTQYANFPQKTKNLFEFVEREASNSPVYKRYEGSIEEVWQEWRRDENWASFKDTERAKLLAYTLYRQAAYSDDNGRKGGVISQFSKQEDYQPNVSRFNKMLLGPFKQALMDILSAETQITEIEKAEDIRSKSVQFYQKLYEMADNDEYEVFQMDDIARDLNFDDITTRKVVQYLLGEGLAEREGQTGIRITHDGIVAAMSDSVIPDTTKSIQEGIHRFVSDHDPSKTVFIMMKFSGGDPVKDDKLNKLFDTIKLQLDKYGFSASRSDDKDYSEEADLWDSIKIYMNGCDYGIAVLENLYSDEMNPNVALEYGYMLALGKRVLLFKEKAFKKINADILGKLWKEFEFDDSKSIEKEIQSWMVDLGITQIKR